jgi:hypothetical protein
LNDRLIVLENAGAAESSSVERPSAPLIRSFFMVNPFRSSTAPSFDHPGAALEIAVTCVTQQVDGNRGGGKKKEI